MQWIEKDIETRQVSKADVERSKLLEEVKRGSLPTIQKEADAGMRPFETMKFQPVKSPGIYEAEFGVKGKDLIFHFWPHDYHLIDSQSKPTPKFGPDFLAKLTRIMHETFDGRRVDIKDDKDMGALFVRATGWGESQFHRELAIKACEAMHSAMGGLQG